MKQSILPPLHIKTVAATTMRTPSTVFTLVVVWIEAQMTLPHFCCRVGEICWLVGQVGEETAEGPNGLRRVKWVK
jgi:hypothetical protein